MAEEAASAAAGAPKVETAAVVEELCFNVMLSSGASFQLKAEPSDAVVVLMRDLAAVYEVPPYCIVKLFQSGQLFLEDAAVSQLDAGQPIFAVVARETKIEILLQGAGSYPGYAEVLREARPDATTPTTRVVEGLPSILHVLEELGGAPPKMDTLRPGAENEGTLVFTGKDGGLILPSLSAVPLLAAAGAEKFARATLSVELNSDAFNRGLGLVVEASPLLEEAVDESGFPTYIYNGYGVSAEGKRQNAVKFHPGMEGGALRVEGVGGFSNQDMNLTPKSWTQAGQTYHTLSITVGADGQNMVTFKCGAGPDAPTWQKPFQRQLTQGTHLPALFAWLDLGVEGWGEGGHPLHIGNVSLQVELA